MIIDATASAGNRTITENAAIPENLYDSVQLHTTQYNLQFSGDYYVSLGQRTVIDFGNSNGVDLQSRSFRKLNCSASVD